MSIVANISFVLAMRKRREARQAKEGINTSGPFPTNEQAQESLVFEHHQFTSNLDEIQYPTEQIVFRFFWPFFCRKKKWKTICLVLFFVYGRQLRADFIFCSLKIK